MKYLVVIFAVCVAAAFAELRISEEHKEIWDKAVQECKTESAIDEAKVNEIKEGKFEITDSMPGTFLLCMYKKVKFMNDEGTLMGDEVKKYWPSHISMEKADEFVTKCKAMIEQSKGKPMEMAAQMMKCWLANKNELGFES